MRQKKMNFKQATVSLLFEEKIETQLKTISAKKIVVITDENIFKAHSSIIKNYAHIILPAGEATKTQTTVNDVVNQLLKLEADKQTVLVGLGGGVVTDIAGYVAGIFKRGMPLWLVPTSVLAMVDAAIGGKNGVNVGRYKNMVGTIWQPQKIIFDYRFLTSLPKQEWVNGFAEIIKHACIKDAQMFAALEKHTVDFYINEPSQMAALIEANVAIKTKIVVADETEDGDRKLLNFGHTLGHAIEQTAKLPHGHAISIGMVAACNISSKLNGFSTLEGNSVKKLLQQYLLPVHINFALNEVWEILLMDKKRSHSNMNFIVLHQIGQAAIASIPLTDLEVLIKESLLL